MTYEEITFKEFEIYLRSELMSNNVIIADTPSHIRIDFRFLVYKILKEHGYQDCFTIYCNRNELLFRPTLVYLTALGIDKYTSQELIWRTWEIPFARIKIKTKKDTRKSYNRWQLKDFTVEVDDNSKTFKEHVFEELEKMKKSEQERKDQEQLQKKQNMKKWLDFEKNILLPKGLTLKEFVEVADMVCKLPQLTKDELEELISQTV